MKIRSVAVIVAVLAATFLAKADSPEDQYVRIYNLIQQADSLNNDQQFSTALAKYVEAQTALTQFQNIHPDWNSRVVKFRLDYLAGKMAEITAKTSPATAVAVATKAAAAPVPRPVATIEAPPINPVNFNQMPPANNSDETIKSLQEQIRQLNGDKASLESSRALLEAKLREALSARPATIDAGEFAKAQDQIRSLLKENDLLKVKMEQSKTKRAEPDPAAMEQLRKELADTKRAMAGLTAANAALVAENVTLRSKNKLPTVADSTGEALRQENEILKKQVAELKKAPAGGGKAADLEKQLHTAQSQLAALESDRDMLRLEKDALENRVKQTGVTGPAVIVDSTNAARIKELESQRDDLLKKLEAAQADLASRKSSDKSPQIEELNGKMAVLSARIEVLEAKPVPYTAEELALLSRPEAPAMLVASVHSPPRKSPSELPANGASLLAEAKRNYAAGDLNKAEASYRQLVNLDTTNIGALADLASIQVNLKHTEDAERNIKAALAIDPNHEYSLFVLGRVKFQEGNYDEALDAFSRAAQANPKNAEIQNYLGITLSEKGLRVPAEAALRKAVQLNPKYGSAHANLAFIYITQKPPIIALAKWHYDKAVESGEPRNPEMEKRLAAAASADSGH